LVNNQSLISDQQLIQLIKDELNVKEIKFKKAKNLSVKLDTQLNAQLIAEGNLRELVRLIQDERKKKGARLDQRVYVTLPDLPELISELKRQVLAESIKKGSEFKVELI
jgi:isoleucyl-tRNA synthetase